MLFVTFLVSYREVSFFGARGKGLPIAVLDWRWGNEGRYTVYGLQRIDVQTDLPTFQVAAQTKAFPHKPAELRSFRTLIDVCSGLRGFSFGAQAANCSTHVFADCNALACRAVVANHGSAVQANVLDAADRQRIHEQCPDFPALLGAGFPCQPYSRQGNGKASLDPRSQVLGGVLALAWEVQAAGLILECVVEASDCVEVVEAIDLLASKMGFCKQEVVLALADQWPCRRRRWWIVLLPANKGEVKLSAWPKAEGFQGVRNIIPEWPVWPGPVEASLQLSALEVSKFSDPKYGRDQRLLDMGAPAPTSLHSYSNQFQGCPCGCRSQGFCEGRLLKDGLRGFVVQSAQGNFQRYAHPQELGLLNAIPPAFVHLEPRAALCLIDQVASPLQSLWVFLYIARWSAEVHGAPKPPCSDHVLRTFKDCLLQQRQDSWVLPSMFRPRLLRFVSQGAAASVQVGQPIRACELLEAEARLQGASATGQVMVGGRPVDGQALLHADSQDIQVLFRSARVCLQQAFDMTDASTQRIARRQCKIAWAS